MQKRRPRIQQFNPNCPQCRLSATGKHDIYQQKAALDSETHEFHDMGMKAGNKTIFAGIPKGKKLVNENFTIDQLDPFDVLPGNKQQSLYDNLCFDNITQEQKDQWYAILDLAPKRKMLTWYYGKSDKHRTFAVQCNECHCMCKYDWNSS